MGLSNVYGNGLIGEETNGVFKTYHFDYRARYYSPAMKRFINADVVAGDISNAVTLNRYAYANGNPVSMMDPLGFEAEIGSTDCDKKNQNQKHLVNMRLRVVLSFCSWIH